MSRLSLFNPEYISHETSLTSLAFLAAVALAAAYAIGRFLTTSPLATLPGPPSPSVFTGHLLKISSPNGGIDFRDSITETYGGMVKLKALLGSDMLYVSDPLALQHILKEPKNFPKPLYVDILDDLLFGPGLLSSHGEAHRRQRKMLNPIFTAPYIRNLTSVFYEVSYQLCNTMKSQLNHSPNTLMDILTPLAQFSLEIIGQAGLGHGFGSLNGRSEDYVQAAKEIGQRMMDISVVIPFLPVLTRIGSPSFRRTFVKYFPWPASLRLSWLVDVMDSTAGNIFQQKKKIRDSGSRVPLSLTGNSMDLITQILKANAEACIDDALSDAELGAQLNTLLFAAMDTTSGALSKILQLLSMHKDVQDRLRIEIVQARKENEGHDLSHQTLHDLPLLSAVIRETLRLHPPVPYTWRIADQDVMVPLRYPIPSTDEQTLISSLLIPKGTTTLIGIISVNTSKRIWGPDAHQWKPERWMGTLPQSVIDAKVPGVLPNLMTFLSGPRACIGYRFAMQEMKVALCVLLESFKFTPDMGIEWRMGVTMAPYTNGNFSKPQLPLKVQYIGE